MQTRPHSPRGSSAATTGRGAVMSAGIRLAGSRDLAFTGAPSWRRRAAR